MTTSHRYTVWTDGAAIGHDTRRGERQPGGWAAVVEYGSDGYVLRGREPDTTNVRMEIRAAVEALRSLPTGASVTLVTDATVITTVHQRWARSLPLLGKDADLWDALAFEFDRHAPSGLKVKLLGRGTAPPQHRRAHSIAGAEARSQAKGLDPSATILSPVEKKERRRAALALLHRPGCTWSYCLPDCPVLQAVPLLPPRR